MLRVDGLRGCSRNPQGLPSLGGVERGRLAFAFHSPHFCNLQLSSHNPMVEATSASASDAVRMTKTTTFYPAGVLVNLAKVLPRM
jgi:hypothetical protein